MRQTLLSLLATVFLFTGLAACADQTEYRSAPGLRFGAPKTIDGREYIVGSLTGERNLYYVTPKRGAANDDQELIRAVAIYSRCQSHKIIERQDQGRTAIVKGVICPS